MKNLRLFFFTVACFSAPVLLYDYFDKESAAVLRLHGAMLFFSLFFVVAINTWPTDKS